MPPDQYPETITAFPKTLDELHAFCNPVNPSNVDKNGRFKWRNGEAVVSFGRHNGETLREVATNAPDFLQWIIRADFDADVKQIAQNALRGKFPVHP